MEHECALFPYATLVVWEVTYLDKSFVLFCSDVLSQSFIWKFDSSNFYFVQVNITLTSTIAEEILRLLEVQGQE